MIGCYPGRLIGLMIPAAVFAAAVLLLPPVGLAQQSDGAPEVEDIIRQLKPAPPPGVRTRGIPSGRGVSVELPGGDQSGAGAAAAPPSVDLRIKFDFNSHTLTSEGEQALHTLGKALTSRDLSEFRFLIAGHTDAVGGEDYNQILSELRARSVKEFLTGTYRIDPARLEAKGFGESRLADPANPDGDVNRRVQITNLGGS